MTAADIVRAAIRISGGLGDAWCSGADVRRPDAVRVGDRIVVVETDGDDLGWLMTTYAVSGDGAEATPIAVIAGESDAVRTLTSWLRTLAAKTPCARPAALRATTSYTLRRSVGARRSCASRSSTWRSAGRTMARTSLTVG